MKDIYCSSCHTNLSEYWKATSGGDHHCPYEVPGAMKNISYGVIRNGKYVRLGAWEDRPWRITMGDLQ